MLELVTLVLVVVTAAWFATQGAFLAAVMWLSVWLAGFFAFWLFEPLARGLEPMLGSFADGVALTGAFCLGVLALRGARRWLVRHDLFFPIWLERTGGALFGMLTGYALAGLILCIWQTLPIHQHFLNYDPHRGVGLGQPDRLWLAAVHRASRQNLRRGVPVGDESYVFDPDASFVWRYTRHRRIPPDGSAPRPHREEFPFGPVSRSRQEE
ncbi:MAG: CvpA family protein [Gemmatales bacterium]|nr:CvpA family protein [Gemmatales bacterium]MDW8221948.1 CvpA family protein [Gemmatales bacterium]